MSIEDRSTFLIFHEFSIKRLVNSTSKEDEITKTFTDRLLWYVCFLNYQPLRTLSRLKTKKIENFYKNFFLSIP